MKRLLFLAAGLALIAYVVYLYDLVEFFSHPERVGFVKFDAVFREVGRCAILLVFLLLFIVKPAAQPESQLPARPRGWAWSLGFLGIFLSLTAFVSYVNPHGMFPWEFVKSSGAALSSLPTQNRSEKIKLFNDLDNPPNILILGSSRAVGIPSARILANTGHDTFNMAVYSGGPLDYLTFGKFVYSQKETPNVLVVELIFPSLRVVETPMPVSMFPYSDSDKKFEMIDNVLHDVISIQSISDTVYQLAYEARFERPRQEDFLPDGTGIRMDMTEANYQAAFERVRKNLDINHKCVKLDDQGMVRLERLVTLATENKSAIVFYRSPLNAAYLDTEGSRHPDITKCESLFADYIANLLAQHPNLFYLDLTYYEPVTSLRENGFYDVHHLRPNAAQLVVDALTPEIQKAMDWALTERSQP